MFSQAFVSHSVHGGGSGGGVGMSGPRFLLGWGSRYLWLFDPSSLFGRSISGARSLVGIRALGIQGW